MLMKPSATSSAGRRVLLGQLGKLGLHRLQAQGLVGMRAKHLGEVARLDLAQHHVGVRHRQRAATAVAGRAGVGTRALRTHAKARTVKRQQRAATGRHGVDAHHGRAHAHAGHLGLELALEFAGVVAHVGGGAAHVKANDLLNAGNGRGPRHAHNATGRAAQNRVLALEGVGIGQAAAGLHEEQLHARHLASHLLHIAAQDGRQVGIDHRGVAAADELHHRAGFMRGADLGEAHLAGQPGRRLFMGGVAVAMHEHNRNTA